MKDYTKDFINAVCLTDEQMQVVYDEIIRSYHEYDFPESRARPRFTPTRNHCWCTHRGE